MTAEIVLQVFRFGFLLLLWLFIFAAFRVVRADLLRRPRRPGGLGAAPRRRARQEARPARARAPSWSPPAR